jgi:hypothetical protein
MIGGGSSNDNTTVFAARETRLSLIHTTEALSPQRTEMAALSDQTANEPLLNDSTEPHSDNLTPQSSSQQNRNDFEISKGRPNDAHRSLFPDDRFWSIACIIGGVVVAVALAVGHHAVLHYLQGRNIDEYPQVWIKGANNGFSNIFSIFVGLSVGTALTQIVRRPLLMSRMTSLLNEGCKNGKLPAANRCECTPSITYSPFRHRSHCLKQSYVHAVPSSSQ